MEFNIPKYVENIVDKLEERGHSAYVVGGSIRDLIIGKVPNDYDVATDASPDQIEEVFNRYKTLEVGKQFGTVVVVQEEGIVEVTTFRQDGQYLDGRRPDQVFFSKDLRDDLSRRDFTINALAYNKRTGIIDYFNGIEDIKNRIIRTVGHPGDRFTEDYLRIIRAVRFASQLNFSIEEASYIACKDYSKNIEIISKERIFVELSKILLSDKPSVGLELLRNIGALEIIIPEIMASIDLNQRNPYHTRDVYRHCLCVVDRVKPILHLRIAGLFHDIGKPHTMTIDDNGIGHFYDHHIKGEEMAREILKGLKASNEIIDKVCLLIKNHMSYHDKFKEKGLKRLLRKIGEDEIFNLLNLQKSDKLCGKIDGDISHLIERENQIKEILDKKEPYNKSHLAINGSDLIKIGYKEGKLIGLILEELLEKVIEDPSLNNRDKLIQIAKMYNL